MGSAWGKSVLVIAATTCAILASARPVAAIDATLKVDPGTQAVSQGAAFTVHIIENAPIKTAGAQATIVFDQKQLQVQSVVRGSGHTGSTAFVPKDMNAAISSANGTGKLWMISTIFVPPAVIQPGAQDFLDITFKATGCGQVALTLTVGKEGAEIMDGTDEGLGNLLNVATSGGSVTINNCASGGAPAAAASQQPQSSAGQAAATAPPSVPTAAGNNATDPTPSASTNSANDGAMATPSANPVAVGNRGNDGASPVGPIAPLNLPLWLPIVFAIPAVAVIWLGLRKWRLADSN